MAQTGMIHTVRGPVNPAALVRTLVHDVVFTRFFGMLGERGISQAELDIMTIENPRRVLAW